MHFTSKIFLNTWINIPYFKEFIYFWLSWFTIPKQVIGPAQRW
ncbi:hypothetical protein UF75_4937 [Desulfosporosinus sp. I2]|nr:hypothetical protein UF75_4937 [Desulfosporosinus sp. I2]